LREYGINPLVSDPFANKTETQKEYGIALVDFDEIKNIDCLIIAVAHDEYKKLQGEKLRSLFNENKGSTSNILIDVKGIFVEKDMSKLGISCWRL